MKLLDTTDHTTRIINKQQIVLTCCKCFDNLSTSTNKGKMKMLKFNSLLTNKGIILKPTTSLYPYWSSNGGGNGLRFNNGVEISHTFKGEWHLLEGVKEVTKIQGLQTAKTVFSHYELIDPSLSNDKIPLILTKKDVDFEVDEDDGDDIWNNYSHLRSLYRSVHNKLKQEWINLEFEINHLGDVEGDIEKPIQAKFKIHKSGWSDNDSIKDVSDVVTYGTLDHIFTPEFALHLKPCNISAENSYNIIRSFVKDNIDKQYAQITSDYDFCLTVKKKISIKPIHHRTEVKKQSGGSYRPPRFKETVTTFKDVEVYNVAPKAYNSYNVIKPFYGDNLEDLVNNIRRYLSELMEYLNTPYEQCPTCSGHGVLIGEVKTCNSFL